MTAPRKGQIVKFRNRKSNRAEYMRLLTDARAWASKDGVPFVHVHGYRTRADGSPIRVRPVSHVLFAAEVEIITREN